MAWHDLVTVISGTTCLFFMRKPKTITVRVAVQIIEDELLFGRMCLTLHLHSFILKKEWSKYILLKCFPLAAHET
jgi:hypothetical protein